MKAQFKKLFRPMGRAVKNLLRPIVKKVRGPLTKLLTPPEFETAIINLEKLTQNLKGYVDQSDQLLLSMFRTLHLPAKETPAHVAVNLGNQRILTRHPVAQFMLVNGNDLQDTPRILLDQYQPGLLKAIQQLAKPGGTYVDFGAGQGYHTLTMATIAGRNGQVFAVEADPMAANILHDNLTATGLSRQATLFPLDRTIANAMASMQEQLAARNVQPDLVRIGTWIENMTLGAWIRVDSPTRFLLDLPKAQRAIPELQQAGYRFWIVQPDGAFFRTDAEEMAELSQEGEIYVLAGRD